MSVGSIGVSGRYKRLAEPTFSRLFKTKKILLRRGTKEGQNQILFMCELNRRLNPIDKDKMNRLKILKNPP